MRSTHETIDEGVKERGRTKKWLRRQYVK